MALDFRMLARPEVTLLQPREQFLLSRNESFGHSDNFFHFTAEAAPPR
jgi:hypothetical protein